MDAWTDACLAWDREELTTEEVVEVAYSLFAGDDLDHVLSVVMKIEQGSQAEAFELDEVA